MKVTCSSVEDFLANVKDDWVTGCPLHRNSIWKDVKEKQTESGKEIRLCLTAVIGNEFGEYLLVTDVLIDKTYVDSSEEEIVECSEKLESEIAALEKFCQVNTLKLRNGTVSY